MPEQSITVTLLIRVNKSLGDVGYSSLSQCLQADKCMNGCKGVYVSVCSCLCKYGLDDCHMHERRWATFELGVNDASLCLNELALYKVITV